METQGNETQTLMINDPEEYFEKMAVNYAREKGYEFSPRCFNLLKIVIRKGAKEFMQRYESEGESLQTQAKNDLINLIDEMILVAQNRGDTYLGESTFFTAKGIICPCPPWCYD